MDPRISVQLRSAALLTMAAAVAGCGKQPAQQQATAPVVTKGTAPTGVNQPGVTPMAQRVAVIAILNKRNSLVQNVALHPGQSVRWKDVVVRLRACETTAPWEPEKLTGAFVQVDVMRPDRTFGRVFSGWLYKESPSLNTVEHPVYDVWPKSCVMTYPPGAPAPAAPATSSNLSSAPKSTGSAGKRPRATAPAPSPPPSAAANNPT
ncbi:hypothetical protein ACUXST_002442 [Sphingomonas sp. F9_3S_D5_B_2]